MSSYKILLEKKYIELLKEISIIIPIQKELLPIIDDSTDWNELINYIDFVFPDSNTKFHIKGLFDYKDISINEEQLILLEPVIKKYLIFIEKVKHYI